MAKKRSFKNLYILAKGIPTIQSGLTSLQRQLNVEIFRAALKKELMPIQMQHPQLKDGSLVGAIIQSIENEKNNLFAIIPAVPSIPPLLDDKS